VGWYHILGKKKGNAGSAFEMCLGACRTSMKAAPNKLQLWGDCHSG